MGWDSTRPVPWQRLAREWLIYVGIMLVVLLVIFRDSGVLGAIVGLLVSGPLYRGLGFVLAKFGYQRKTMREIRAEREADVAAGRTGRRKRGGDDDEPVAAPRPRPAPTRRTSGGGSRPSSRKRRR